MAAHNNNSLPSPARRRSEEEQILKQYDAAMAEILLRRVQNPPELGYLNLEADGSMQSRSYNYSPAMVNAIGVNGNRVPKGSFSRGVHADGGPPWASVPKSMEDPIVSVAGADYVARTPLPDVPEVPPGGTLGLIKKARSAKEQRVQRRDRTRKLLEDLEDARRLEIVAQQAKQEEEKAKLGALKEKVKCFTHAGIERRAISAPLPGDSDEEDQELVMRKRTAVVRADKPIQGTMGLRLPVTQRSLSTMSDSVQVDCTSTTDVDVALDNLGAPQRPSTFWYPKDRQRFKHRTLEEQRLANAQEMLLQQGWAQSTDLGGAPKRTGAPNILAGLPADERDRIEKQLVEFLAAKQQRDEEARVRYNTMIAKPRPSELRGTVPVLSSPFAHEDLQPLREQVNDKVREAVDVAAAAAATGTDSDRHPAGRVYVRPFMFERPPPFKPLPVYRPELPAARVPEEIVRLELPMDDEMKKIKGQRGAAPPWGRDSAEDEKWARIRINKTTKQVEVKPLTKREVSTELRLVRDKGLMKRPRQSVAATMTPAQQEFIRSIPSTGPLVAQAAMRPALRPQQASL
jgi:hypothetical protein